MTRPKTSLLLLCVLVMTSAGCASIGGRGDERFYPGVYPGVRNHAYYFAHPKESDKPGLWWLAIIDFPLSAALDTALLPWDLPYWAFRHHDDRKADSE